jgi:hypothetical protein
MCKLKNILLNNYWLIEEIKEKIKRYLGVFEKKTTNIQNLLYTESKRQVYKIQAYHRKLPKKVSNEQPNLTPEKIRTSKTES